MNGAGVFDIERHWGVLGVALLDLPHSTSKL